MANAYTVLVVDDEPPILRFLRTSLGAVGYRVVTAEDARRRWRLFDSRKARCRVLDLGLPDRSGFEVIAEIRKHSPVPIIVLSARTDERAKVEALDLGADDYVGKAVRHGRADGADTRRFAPRLPGAGRIAGLRLGRSDGRSGPPPCRRAAVRRSNCRRRSSTCCAISSAHAGKVLTHRHLLREVWGPAQAEEVQYLRVFIRGLRQKLEPDPTRPTHILTELGVGYRLQLPPEQRAPGGRAGHREKRQTGPELSRR